MIEVEVTFLSDVRKMTDEGKTVIPLREKSSVRDLVAALVERYGVGFNEFLLNHGRRLKKYVVILVNGRGIDILNGLETVLRHGDSISVMPAVGGG